MRSSPAHISPPSPSSPHPYLASTPPPSVSSHLQRQWECPHPPDHEGEVHQPDLLRGEQVNQPTYDQPTYQREVRRGRG